MSFFSRARAAGAAEYGRVRAEKYGRQARAARVVVWLLVIGLIVWAWSVGR